MDTIAISDLSIRAQKMATKRIEADEGRPVYARSVGSGHALVQIDWIDVNGPQYEAEEAWMADLGWKRVDFCA